MPARNPPPTYEETLGRGGQPRVSTSNFASWGGRGSGTKGPAGMDYRSTGGSAALPEDVSAGDVARNLRSGGLKVVIYPPQRGKPEERLAMIDQDEFSLKNGDGHRSGNVLSFMQQRKTAHYPLKNLMEVKLGVAANEIWSPRNAHAGGAVVTTRRLSDHVPNPDITIRMRFSRDTTVYLAAYSRGETIYLFDELDKRVPRRNTRAVPAGVPPQTPHRTNPNPSPIVGGRGAEGGVVVRAAGSRRPNGTLKNAYTSFDGSPRRDGLHDNLEDSFRPPQSVGGRDERGGGLSQIGKLPNGGAKRQRSNLKAMMEQEGHYYEARNAFLADPNLDGNDVAADALRPHTLAEVSGAVPQTPSCYVPRLDDLTRLRDALVPDWGAGKIGGGTTVIYDPVANGKSVLAAAAMQDPRVQDVFPGGFIWLRAGRAAAGRLLRMMELAVCQLAEEIERAAPGSIAHVPERFSDVGAASDYLASILVRTSAGGGLRETLLVLDDVWEASVAEAFERVGLSLLVTTREPLIARLATPNASGQARLIGPLGPLSGTEATAAAAKAAATRRAPPKEAKLLLDRTGRCPLAVGVVGSTLKQAQSPMEWTATSAKVHKTFHGLQRVRDIGAGEEEEEEDRITASIAAGLSNMPEENQMLYSALCILPPGLPVTCRLLEQVWETGKRTTILAAEAFEHRRLLDRLGPGNFVLHYEAARFLQHPPGFAGEGAWVGCKLRGQGRELAFNRLCKHLDSFDTLRDHLEKRDLWGLTELWQTCELEAEKTSGHSHVSCRIYESRLDLLRQEAVIEAGPLSKARTSKVAAKKAYEATLDLAQALNMVADYQAYGGCCDAAPLYAESINSLQRALEFVAVMGERGSTGAGALESRVKRALERISGKLGAHFLKQGRERDALSPCMESLSLLRARQGTENLGGMGRNGSGLLPHQDVVDSLLSMAEALIISKRVEEGEGMFEEAAITLRRLYGEDASLCLEARATERLAEMMLDAGRAERAYELNERCLEEANSAFGDVHPAIARVLDQKGQILLSLKELEAAATWFSESRRMRETFYGKGHALVAPSLENQALLEMNMGNVRDAELLLEECLSIQRERYGPEDARVKATMVKLQECRSVCADQRSPDTGGGPSDDRVYVSRPGHGIAGGGSSAHAIGQASPAGGGQAEGGQLGGGGGEMETEEARLKRELVAAEGMDDGGREAAAAQGRWAKHLKDSGPSRLEEAEEAYSNWVKKLQSEVDGQRAGTDAELRASILDYIAVLEDQDKDPSNMMFELLRVDKRVFGNDAPEYGDDMERVGRYLASRQTYGQAEHLLKKALVIKEKNSGRDHPDAAGILRAIGRVLFEMKALKDAGEAFDRALAIDNRGDSPADVIEDMRSLGMVYCRQGVYEKAEGMYRKVVEMDRKFRGGEEDPAVITEMNVWAVLLYAQGKMDKAEPLLKNVLALREKVLGPDHVDAAESLVNLAVLNNRKGKYDEALPMLNRALAILRQAHGDLHPETVACWSWIAETHQRQAQYSEAEGILMQVVTLNRKILGDDHPGVADSLSDLAELRRAQGKLDEAEEAHLEALRIREDYFGPDHDTVAQSAQMLSLLLQSSGREDEAQEYGRRVVQIREKVHEAGLRYSSSRNNVASASQEHGENARRNHARSAVEKSITRLR